MEERIIRGGKKGQQTTQKNRINEDITGKEVRLIDIDGEQAGIVSLRDAQAMADEAGVDLVEISPNAEPPVCKVMDYGKFIFEKSKELKEQKKKQKQIQIKEIKFRPGTDDGDYNVKLRSLRKFLEGGDKAKITIRFRGREMAHQEIGIALLNRIKTDLEDISSVESFPNRVEGRQMVMMMAPVAKK
ncbi:translation initiation factor IF-3 [Pseudoalteromonas ulvae UL12]|uniref:Translation initiation factor IF-3 n=1 Tax=Pseudoalteromonas ulvae TaxID=107327 RepID=A0A244CMN1_PSEDV|nr:translation initiation factor IF-3 [Pseudoalteromonas ulvae]MBE0364074.1 translation initiation factor IF-3 [Pseudoalteromonas ulvae UL12]OUL56845.1 translation initiation factor IF-3 [Pseudoalteromonas ulvae]